MTRCTLPAFVAAAIFATACGGNDNAQGDGSGTAQGTAPTATQSAQASPNVVTFTARDYVFEGPTEVPAGVTTIQLMNQGPELHHATLVKLEEGRTGTDYIQALKPGAPPPTWAQTIGGPNAPAPGETANATQTLTPGNYAFVCFIPSPDGIPHFAQLVQLAPGKTPKDVIDWVHKPQGPPPGKPIGGIAGMIPGQPAYFTVNVTPGEYALICFLPDHKDGKEHYEHAMIQQITVS